jgi:membrane associated rhomboid family serine protease
VDALDWQHVVPVAGWIHFGDTWGRAIYSVFYLFTGAAAMQFYVWCTPGSFVPLVGDRALLRR